MSKPIDEIRHLAVYGTLMRAFNTQHQLGVSDQLIFEGPCQFDGVLYDLGAYPGAVPGTDVVYGECFRLLNMDILPILDRFEGYHPRTGEPSLYVRSATEIEMSDDGSIRPAWIYWYDGALHKGSRIPSGSWFDSRRSEQQGDGTAQAG